MSFKCIIKNKKVGLRTRIEIKLNVSRNTCVCNRNAVQYHMTFEKFRPITNLLSLIEESK